MKHFSAKALIFITCAALLIEKREIDTYLTVSILVALIISTLPYIIMDESYAYHTLPLTKSQKNIMMLIIFSVFLLAGFIHSYVLCFIPLVVYDCILYDLKPGYLVCLVTTVLSYFSLGVNTGFFLTLLSFGAAFISKSYVTNDKLAHHINSLRDSSTEHEIVMAKANKLLKQNQDDAVYMATLQERNRIAREIHDNVGHLLTRSILQTGAIKAINKDEKLQAPIDSLKASLDTAMSNIRESVHDLHDESVDLEASIRNLASDIGNFRITLDYDAGKNVPKNIKYSFIAITKEAINNAVKYSNGDTISIILREHPGFYQLMISDNGTANANTSETGHGIGLSNISDRVDEIGGNLQLTTTNGYKILVTVMKQ